MEYTGPTSLLETDLALSEEEDDGAMEHWPPLPSSPARDPPIAVTEAPSTSDSSHPCLSATSAKRPMDDNSDSGSETRAPASKTPKHTLPVRRSAAAPLPALPDFAPRAAPLPALPAFAPRAAYVKLAFRERPSVETKLRWLAEVNKSFSLQRDLAEVKMAAVTSRFVYIARCRQDIVERVTEGEFLSLTLDVQDSPERPRKYPSYLVTRYPVGVDPSLAMELPGVHSARRFRQDGVPINRIVVTWSLSDPPPATVSFSFLPCLPDCEIRRIRDDIPSCYRCWGVGHISRYCSALEKCAWCAGTHDSRTCPHRAPPPPPTDSSSTTVATSPSNLPASTNIHWKCPRCNKQGVNVWHGCVRRPVKQPTPPPPPPPVSVPPVPVASASSESDQTRELREAVATLMSRCKSLEEWYDAFEARLIGLAAKQESMDTVLNTLVEGQKAMTAMVSSIDDKFGALSSRLSKTNEESSTSSSHHHGTQRARERLAASSTVGSRKHKGKVQ